jgi:hypothetical protein
MWNQYVALVDGFKIITLIVLIIADLVLGIIVAAKAGTFKLSKIAQFLNTTVLTLIGGYFIVGFIALVEPSFSAIVIASWALLDITLIGSITGKLGALGIPMPKILSNPPANEAGGSTTTTTTTTTNETPTAPGV